MPAAAGVTPRIVLATRSSYADGITPLRRRLFEHVCVSSLRAQTDGDFLWIIRVAASEDLTWRREVTAGLNVLLTPETWQVSFAGLNTARIARLDDDDAIAGDFVERLRNAAAYRAGQWLTFPNGIRVSEGKAEPFHNRPNQFIARDGGDVYEIKHRDLPASAIEIDQRPAWLFVRHPESKSEGGRGPTTRPLSELTAFGVQTWALASDLDPLAALQSQFACQHRGEPVETLECKPCQNSLGLTRVPVFACGHPHRTHHPTCVLSTVATPASDGLRPQACATCALRKE